jgi:hypothetical protein
MSQNDVTQLVGAILGATVGIVTLTLVRMSRSTEE